MGNSHGVVLPKPVLAQLGAEPGGDLEMTVEAGRVVLAAVPRQPHPRAGWGEASRALAASGDDGVDDDWVDFDDRIDP